ncbi:uncharacterized protein B0T23DRAFT_374860 [Neurospora hispaniola]|uniref:Uncharacterized protein n=1 Tax=Neurospora hispaniola TaxID=588809 RepID=A0AAJ0MU48_9PEZI|nr:hypothetical protein B0T23DRAFT_374860 [Neurospora hispaniola]
MMPLKEEGGIECICLVRTSRFRSSRSAIIELSFTPHTYDSLAGILVLPWFVYQSLIYGMHHDMSLLSPGIRIFGGLGRGRFDSFHFHNLPPETSGNISRMSGLSCLDSDRGRTRVQDTKTSRLRNSKTARNCHQAPIRPSRLKSRWHKSRFQSCIAVQTCRTWWNCRHSASPTANNWTIQSPVFAETSVPPTATYRKMLQVEWTQQTVRFSGKSTASRQARCFDCLPRSEIGRSVSDKGTHLDSD